jgi:succinylglutamate desuccinylase
LPATAILGLEEVIEGVFAGFLTDRGHVGIAVEAGQHQDPRCLTRLVALMSLVLLHEGCLRHEHLPELPAWRAELAGAAAGQPALVEVRHRHVVAADDEFEMLPGFSSFVPVARDQLVARDRKGWVHAPEAGLMLMPRYQGQGEDGYFLVRAVPPDEAHPVFSRRTENAAIPLPRRSQS